MPTLLELLKQNPNELRGYWVYLNNPPNPLKKESQTDRNAGEIKEELKKTPDQREGYWTYLNNPPNPNKRESQTDRNAGEIKEELKNTPNQREGYWTYLNNPPNPNQKESQTDRNAGDIKKEFNDRQSPFKNRELYGLFGTTIIESQGIVNPARASALLLSSPNPVASFIGSQIAPFVKAGAGADRPDDLIFGSPGFFSKPITTFRPTAALLRDAVQGGEQYFVKTERVSNFPAVKKIVNSFKNPAAGISLGIAAIKEYGGKSGFKKLSKMFKKKGDDKGYGPSWMSTSNTDVKKNSEEVIQHSTHFTKFVQIVNPITKRKEFSRTTGEKKALVETLPRKYTKTVTGMSLFDMVNDDILNKTAFDKEKYKSAPQFKEQLDRLKRSGYVFVYIKLYGKNKGFLLPGAISGISEDFAPEINGFKYVGSPFSVYRYSGVERTIKFNLKVYALDGKQEFGLRNKLDELRKLVYPDEDLVAVKYAKSDTASPIYFTPNLIELTIYGLYNGVVGIVDTLSITVPDEIPWASYDYGDVDDNDISIPHPVLFDVSFGMKVINNPTISAGNGNARYELTSNRDSDSTVKYTNYFTGYGNNINDNRQAADELDEFFLLDEDKKKFNEDMEKYRKIGELILNAQKYGGL